MQNGMNRFSEEELLKVASDVCNLSLGNVVLVGGGAALPQTAGFKRLRPRSDDLDFIARRDTLDDITERLELRPEEELGIDVSPRSSRFTYINGILVAIFPSDIRGYDLGEEFFSTALLRETSKGRMVVSRPEINMALKIRRGCGKGHIYGKDACDFATFVIGLKQENREFDTELFLRYMKGVCEYCDLEEGECMDSMRRSASNLGAEFRGDYLNVIDECSRGLESYGSD